MYKDTLQKVKRFMTETGMLQNCSEIILGVSGGPDSMTMLHILNELRDEFGYRLRVVHVNHGIRGKEALRDQQTVEKICSEWKIPCAVYNYDVPALALSWKMGTEEAGRKVRRIALKKRKKMQWRYRNRYVWRLHITKMIWRKLCCITWPGEPGSGASAR